MRVNKADQTQRALRDRLMSRGKNCLPTVSQERKISPKSKFWGRISRGHPGVIRADIPPQNFGQGTPNAGKTSTWARTSMTRRGGRPRPQGTSKNFGQKNFGAEFSFPSLEAIFDSQLPSPKLSPKMPPKLSLPHKRGLFYPLSKLTPRRG